MQIFAITSLIGSQTQKAQQNHKQLFVFKTIHFNVKQHNLNRQYNVKKTHYINNNKIGFFVIKATNCIYCLFLYNFFQYIVV